MIHVISKSTFGEYEVRDIQCNANWDCCPYSDYALIPDDLVEGILATQGYCDIVLSDDGSEVVSFTAREIPSVPEECCGSNTVLSVNGVTANTAGEVTIAPRNIGAQEKHLPETITLTAANWIDQVQTVAVNGVTEENTIVISTDPGNYTSYVEAVVRCSAQADNALTFTCNDVPEIDLLVNVMILN